MASACAMALQNVLGLVCDPVAGLVEVPCVKRNVMGAVNALACADMALAGIAGAIPCDEVIDAMASIGPLFACLPAGDRGGRPGGHAHRAEAGRGPASPQPDVILKKELLLCIRSTTSILM